VTVKDPVEPEVGVPVDVFVGGDVIGAVEVDVNEAVVPGPVEVPEDVRVVAGTVEVEVSEDVREAVPVTDDVVAPVPVPVPAGEPGLSLPPQALTATTPATNAPPTIIDRFITSSPAEVPTQGLSLVPSTPGGADHVNIVQMYVQQVFRGISSGS
jgi:hypothetical protein